MILAALGPRMLALAARDADGAFAHLVTFEYVRNARKLLDEEAYKARREARPALIVTVPVCLTGNPSVGRQAGRVALAPYLHQEEYARYLVRCGFSIEDVAATGSDRLVDELVVWGEWPTVQAKLNALKSAGADHFVLAPISVEGKSADDATEAELAALIYGRPNSTRRPRQPPS